MVVKLEAFSHSSLPERSRLAAAGHCSLRALHRSVMVQEGVGWAALPGCD